MAHIDINAVNIRAASFRGDLRLIECTGRFGPYVSIQDKFGTIEVADTMHNAEVRIAEVINQPLTDDDRSNYHAERFMAAERAHGNFW